MPAFKNFSAVAFLFLLFGTQLDAATNLVKIREIGSINPKYVFDPTNVFISTGDTLKWTNTAVNLHDSTHTNRSRPLWGSLELSNKPPNNTFSFTFSNAGFYPYYCLRHVVLSSGAQQHPEQTGTVTVVSANLPPTVSLIDPQNGATFF